MKLATTTKLKLIWFMLGMMFWYGIEQLFMNNILKDPNARALTTTVYTVTLLLLDIPGGIIADRFGRRRTLIIGSTLLMLSVLIMGTSHSMPVFLLGVATFGVYWALCNGAAQAMMYDHLAENNRHGEYAKQQGSTYAFGYMGAGIANVLSGFIAHFWGLRTPYLLSAVPAALALFFALSLHESRLHRASAIHPRLVDYPLQLLKTFRHSRVAFVFALQIVIGLIVFMTICEFGQMTLLSYNPSSIWLGLVWAVDAAVIAAALHHAHRLQKWHWQSTGMYAAVLLLFAFAVPHAFFGTLLFMATYAGVEVIHNISEAELQHTTDSLGRATVLSSVTFFGNLVAVGAIWAFNSVIHGQGIIRANQFTALTIAALFICTASLTAYSLRKARRV